jgi:hypothetical protein
VDLIAFDLLENLRVSEEVCFCVAVGSEWCISGLCYAFHAEHCCCGTVSGFDLDVSFLTLHAVDNVSCGEVVHVQ